ncbi:putative NADPH-quinone reductase [Onishia taeanensis]|uniref:Putative NADPH-quinone reductase n=1 Tax=Onishia taeanensis TaxID=284577 RepID=A0A328XYA0_9GAMM|nr:NAD(P)H-dependent oxidoreductase [Halomonas taeanensis]RAR61592.1 putative NADPH-quinone reductase [Halomonas taeanensis]
MSRILIVQGHPDTTRPHLCHALADQYREGAESAGHDVHQITVTELDFPLLKSQQDWEHGVLPAALEPVQQEIKWAQHLVLIFPLWLGGMPALVKGFLEQVARPGFAFEYQDNNPLGKKGLTGRSARILVTMGMPALVYRHFFRAHSVKALERNILGFVGFMPIRETLIGSVETMSDKTRLAWFRKLRRLGKRAE